MNRRSFLRGLLASPLLALVPKWLRPKDEGWRILFFEHRPPARLLMPKARRHGMTNGQMAMIRYQMNQCYFVDDLRKAKKSHSA